MTVKERIKKFCKLENITVSAFEDRIGVSNGYVNSISKSVGVDKIEAILENFPNINLEWLLCGKGSMLKEGTTAPEQHDEPQSIAERQLDVLETIAQDLTEIKIHIYRLREEQKERETGKKDGSMCG